MKDPANGVVESLGRREGLVTTLVGDNPKTSTEQTLENGVESPEASSDRGRRNVLGSNKVVCEEEGSSDADNVASDVVEASGSRTLEAVSRDSFTDLLDGVVGDLELVAVGVDQGTALVLEGLIDRIKRSQGAGRGRVARRIGRRDDLRGSRRTGNRVVGDSALDGSPLCGKSSGGSHCVSERRVSESSIGYIGRNKERQRQDKPSKKRIGVSSGER